jgi:hypothetical protein
VFDASGMFQKLIDLIAAEAWEYSPVHFGRIHIHDWIRVYLAVSHQPIAQDAYGPEVGMLTILAG